MLQSWTCDGLTTYSMSLREALNMQDLIRIFQSLQFQTVEIIRKVTLKKMEKFPGSQLDQGLRSP